MSTELRYIWVFLVLMAGISFGSPAWAADQPAAQPPPASKPLTELAQNPGRVANTSPTDPTKAPMTDIFDIKPPVKFGMDPRVIRYILIGVASAVVLAALIAAVVWLIKRRKKREAPQVPAVPLEQAIMLMLNDLPGLMGVDDREFYFRLSQVMREYIQGRWGIEALEMTTEELLPRVEKMGLDRSLKDGIRGLALSGDPVKFAGMPAVREKMETDLGFVKDLVRRTTPDIIAVDNEPQKVG